jgi:tetratricopeptide (TPR) repeat protein
MKQPKNVDANERLLLVRTAFWSLSGAVLGGFIGGQLLGIAGTLVGAPIGYAVVFLVARRILNASGAAASVIYYPTGDSTPAQREYSRPQALVAQGHFEEAIHAYEACVLEFPEDPEPYFRIARVYRNELQRYEEAASWFKKARSLAKMSPALEQVAIQEIVEIYTHKLATPQRAIPELARLADRFPGTEPGHWAKQRLQELRATMVQNQGS